MWFLNPAVQEFSPKCETFLKFIKHHTIFLHIVGLVRHHYALHPFLEHRFAYLIVGHSIWSRWMEIPSRN